MTATLLPIPDDHRFELMIEDWHRYEGSSLQYPRAAWLAAFERLLREFYPSANSRSLSLTARSVAPFPLRDGPNVP